ncbi:DNA glycosylase/AP lyase ROS1 [Linum perenne]
MDSGNWLFGSEGDFPPGFPPATAATAAHCGGAAEDTCTGYEAADLERWKDVPFQCLLAFADCAPSVAATGAADAAAVPALDRTQLDYGANLSGNTVPQYEFNLPREHMAESLFGETNLSSFFVPETPYKAREGTVAAQLTTNKDVRVESGNGLLHCQGTDKQGDAMESFYASTNLSLFTPETPQKAREGTMAAQVTTEKESRVESGIGMLHCQRTDKQGDAMESFFGRTNLSLFTPEMPLTAKEGTIMGQVTTDKDSRVESGNGMLHCQGTDKQGDALESFFGRTNLSLFTPETPLKAKEGTIMGQVTTDKDSRVESGNGMLHCQETDKQGDPMESFFSLFTPETPLKAKEGTVMGQVTTDKDTTVESGTGMLHCQETDKQVDDNADGNEAGNTVPVPDTSSTVVMTQENQESAPRKKAKRKKHVPKVMVDGRKPKPRKPQTDKPKRKYERRKGLSPNTAESADSSANQTGKKNDNVSQDAANKASNSPVADGGTALDPVSCKEGTPRSKRKYTRKNPTKMGSGSGSNPQAPEVAVKEDTPRVKRKYTKKTIVRNAWENNLTEKDGKASNPQAPEPAAVAGDLTCKRRNMGDYPLHEFPTTPPAEATGESADPQGPPQPAKRSCKRVLDFSSKKQVGQNTEKPSPSLPSKPEACSQSTSITLGQEVEVRVQKNSAGFPYDFNDYVDKMLWNYSAKVGYLIPSPANAKCSTMNANSSKDHVKEKEGNRLMQQNNIAMSQSAAELLPSIPNASSYGSGRTLTDVGEASGGALHKHSVPAEPANDCINVTEPFYSGLSLNQTFPWELMPDSGETSRENCQIPAVSSLPVSPASEVVVPTTAAANINYSNFAHSRETGLPEMRGIQYKQQNYSPSNEIEVSAERRSGGAPSHFWDLVSVANAPLFTGQAQPSCDNQHIQNLNKPLETLHPGSQANLKTKQRSKKDSVAKYAYSSMNDKFKGSDGVMVPFNQNQFSNQTPGSLNMLFNEMLNVDALAEQLKRLNINRKRRPNARARKNELVPHKAGKQKQNTMVIYKGDNRMVPYDGPFEPMKRRRPRAKVEIDEETIRVFNLLLKDIDSEGVDGTTEENRKYWEEQRRIFRGRTDSFIARMHLVQGDRRFSKWKGSVVDSVIGVFLTQNVSDHLSSSAFMSMAARYPAKRHQKPQWEEATVNSPNQSIVINPTVSMPDEETLNWDHMSNQSIYGRSSMTLRDPQHKETEVAHTLGITRSMSSNIESAPGQEKYYESVISSQNSFVSSQNSNSPVSQSVDRKESSSETNSQELDTWDGAQVSSLNIGSSFVDLLQTPQVGSTMLHQSPNESDKASSVCIQTQRESVEELKLKQYADSELQQKEQVKNISGERFGIVESSKESISQKTTGSNLVNRKNSRGKGVKDINAAKRKAKSRRVGDEIRDADWEALRRSAKPNGRKERAENTMDSVDWETVRSADVNDIAETIKARGMNRVLAGRIKDFLNQVVSYHGSVDLEWLRDVHPDRAKEYLLSFNGLGLKSVECVRLLTLHHLAFPVDTNVGRIAVRLGWVPLMPLPESLQLHLLEMYPILDTIQKYLWPRLCKLDQKTLYELHYQLITFGKVFCTKSKPNCNACPMRGECRHFASAFASARLALPGPEEKRMVNVPQDRPTFASPVMPEGRRALPPPTICEQQTHSSESLPASNVSERENQQSLQLSAVKSRENCEPIIEEPLSPEPVCTTQDATLDIGDIEDAFTQGTTQYNEDTFYEDPDEIPTLKLNEIPAITLNVQELAQNIEMYIKQKMDLHDGDISLDLVAMATEATYMPPPKLKNISRLRTEHRVYELSDSHPLVQGLDKREDDDPSPYLLAIWTPGETADSIEPPERTCTSQSQNRLCNEGTCPSCSSYLEARRQIVRGTILIPCRTAMRGSFPLNGTYFQVNEVFADHETSLNPIEVPRSLLWNLPRRTVNFGTSVPTIFKGLTTDEIQQCFWRGFVCVRGFDRETRAPRPLLARLHFPASKLKTTKSKNVAHS